jgi:hypothetical protein
MYYEVERLGNGAIHDTSVEAGVLPAGERGSGAGVYRPVPGGAVVGVGLSLSTGTVFFTLDGTVTHVLNGAVCAPRGCRAVIAANGPPGSGLVGLRVRSCVGFSPTRLLPSSTGSPFGMDYLVRFEGGAAELVRGLARASKMHGGEEAYFAVLECRGGNDVQPLGQQVRHSAA